MSAALPMRPCHNGRAKKKKHRGGGDVLRGHHVPEPQEDVSSRLLPSGALFVLFTRLQTAANSKYVHFDSVTSSMLLALTKVKLKRSEA